MVKRTFGILLMLLSCMSAMAQIEADAPQVFFRVGSARLNMKDIPQALVDSVNAACARGERFTVTGVASPEGNYRSNVRLASRRAKAIVKGLRKLTGQPATAFCIKTLVTSVETLRQLAAQDDSLPAKQQVMNILSANEPTGATLAKLKKIDGGTPYLYIKDRLFPYLRTSVGSDKDSVSFHPNLNSEWKPEIVQRDHRTIQTKSIKKAVADTRSAVTKNMKSRHSSYLKDTLRQKSASVDSVSHAPEQPVAVSDTLSAANGNKTEKIAETEKNTDSDLLYWSVIGVLLLVLVGIIIYYRRKVDLLQGQLNDAENELNIRNRQLKESEEKGKSLYKDGEALLNHLMIGGSTTGWTPEQIGVLIEYYKIQNYPLVHSLETDYDNLSQNHILFESLVDMGKSDTEIQRMMNVSQATIRSYRFRIKNKKL